MRADAVRGRRGRMFFWLSVAALLSAMAAVQISTVRQESQVYDESNQLLSGYTYLTTGRFTVGLENPPLAKLLLAAPVAWLRPDPPPQDADPANPWPAGLAFLYHNRIDADSMLMAGRLCAAGISLLLGIAIAAWGKRLFGAPVALAAVFLYTLDPNFLANGRYIKNDVATALAIFAAVMAWGSYLMRPAGKRLLLSGLLLGLAITTKFSSLYLIPVMAILYAIRQWQERRPWEFGAFVRRFAVLGGVAFATIFVVYGFEVRPLGESGIFQRLAGATSPMARIPVPALSFFRGMGEMELKQTEIGLSTGFVWGVHSRLVRWYMSPVAIAVKTPLAELALFVLAAGYALRRLARTRIREIDFKWFLLAIPPLAYFALSMATKFNAGLRHLLPVYPFAFLLGSAILLSRPVSKRRAAALIGIAALLVAETVSIHPYYLAFFNAAAGGPAGGRRFLVDSNLDWGQDVKRLKSYLDAHGITDPAISYFGMAELEYYGIRYTPLPDLPDKAAARSLNRVVAVSVTNLMLNPKRYAALHALPPDAKIGYSIYVYDLRQHRDEPGE